MSRSKPQPATRLRRGDLLPSTGAGRRRGRLAAVHQRRARRYETPGLAPPADSQNPVWVEALGSNVLTDDGRRYIDLTSGFGVATIGHRHPAVVAAIRRQSARLIHGLGDAQSHPLRSELAAALLRRAPIAGGRVAFAISGADAVELAVKSALLATGRSRIVAFEPSYHGLTLGALALSSRAHFRRDFRAHLHRQLIRLPYGCAMSELRAALTGGNIAAIVVEPIVGREGIVLPPAGWLAELGTLARHAGALVIDDEILTGGGRTGRWFAASGEALEPDLICCGKGLAGGMPWAAVIGREEVMNAWDRPGEARHTATFVAQPLACAAALATLGVLSRERLIRRAQAIGRRLESALAGWPRRLEAVRSVRGRGALWGIEWQQPEQAAHFSRRLGRRGLLVLNGGSEARVTQLLPPLVITPRQLDYVVDCLSAAARE